MDGISSINFSTSSPVNASNFGYDPSASDYCDYAADYDTWEISAYGMPVQQQGKMTLVYTADNNAAAVLNLLLCGALHQGTMDCGLTVKINGNVFVQPFAITQSSFFATSWYIPAGVLSEGNNTIELEKSGLTNVMVRTASIMQYQMQRQQQTQWCWAAVSASTSLFFNADSSWTQCKLANAEFSQANCCETNQGGCPACNQPYFLQRSLATTGNFVSETSGSQTVEQILAQLGEQRPVGVRIQWPNGSGHFVMVTGVGQNQQMLSIDDPFYGHSYISYASFVSAYQSDGTWNYTYFVKP